MSLSTEEHEFVEAYVSEWAQGWGEAVRLIAHEAGISTTDAMLFMLLLDARRTANALEAMLGDDEEPWRD